MASMGSGVTPTSRVSGSISAEKSQGTPTRKDSKNHVAAAIWRYIGIAAERRSPVMRHSAMAAAKASRRSLSFRIAVSSRDSASGEPSRIEPRHQSNAARASDSFSSLAACLSRGPKSLTCSGNRLNMCTAPRANHRSFVSQQAANKFPVLQDGISRASSVLLLPCQAFFEIGLLTPILA